MNGDTSSVKQNGTNGRFWILLLALGGALMALCHEAFLPHYVHWANDMPLGAMLDPANRLPGTIVGHWETLYYIGGADPSSSPAFSTLLQIIFPPQIYLKIFVPLCMFVLGFGAWFLFKQLGFAAPVCVVGGLGAGLNMHYFSNACWGLGTWSVMAAMVFIALGIIVSPSIRSPWSKGILAGLATGMIVMEGFDSGALLTLFVGAFVIFYFLITGPSIGRRISKAIGMEALVVIFAVLISASTMYTLVGTQINGITTTHEDAADKQAKSALSAKVETVEHLFGFGLDPGVWDFATMFSFPKLETTRLVIPGLFGYRLQDYITDTNHSSAYWGRISEDPHIDQLESDDPKVRSHAAATLGLPADVQALEEKDDKDALAAREQILDSVKGQLQRRHTGSGDYTGELVCLLAVFGLCNSWRKTNSPYSKQERISVWFWAIAALVSLMAAWGRYSFIYPAVFHLPFMSNVRNPIKFLHALNLCLIILAGYGLEALYRRYLAAPVARAASWPGQVSQWWRKAAGFDKYWAIGSVMFLGLAVLGLVIYGDNRDSLIHYLQRNGFSEDAMPGQAAQMAAFSLHEVFLFSLFYAVSTVVILLGMTGVFSGKRATWAWVILGSIMIIDLARADLPWVRYYDTEKVLSMNPVVDFLRKNPWEHRVMSRWSPTGGYMPAGGGAANLPAICHWWIENDYLANNINTLEIDQAPRLPDLDRNYIGDFANFSQQDLSPPARMWRLTNTKYLLVDARLTEALNQLAQPRNSFSNVMRMDIVQKPGVEFIRDAGDFTVQTNANGAVALVEFTNALPRAKLYSAWQVMDDGPTLALLNSAKFDPEKTVLIASDTPLAEKPAQPDAAPGEVRIVNYQPRYVQLEADAKTPAVLLLNDRTGEYWTVKVDQKPVEMLRCNYIMRGVYLTPGHHTIEFHFRAPMRWFYLSSAALALGILLAGYVIVGRCRAKPDAG